MKIYNFIGPAVSERKVSNKISLKNRKILGIDKITSNLKIPRGKGIGILTKIWNQIYGTGHLPKEFKHSTFSPIVK